MNEEDVKWAVNYDLDNICTPVKADVLNELLVQANYDVEKLQYVVNGFRTGFSLKFSGNRDVKRLAPNLKLRIGSHLEIWNKVMKEVEGKRYAGPYEKPPFDHFIQSPIGLVPKDGGKKDKVNFPPIISKNQTSQ